MYRRLYFLLPDKEHTHSVVDELTREGISIRNMHTHGTRGTALDGLPAASPRQTNDAAGHLENFLWNANLISFVVAFGIFIILAITTGRNLWLLAPVVIMVANFLIGVRFARLPNTHLDEFRDALAHGEILLMVDVTEERVADIENLVHRHHPEATVGGVSWGTPAFGL
jgi:hypothetical protein